MEMTQEQFTLAVTSATEAVLEKTVRLGNRKVVVQSVLTSVVCACVLAIGTTLILSHVGREVAHENSERNCEVQASARPQGNARAFLQRVTLGLAEDFFRRLPKPFRDAEVARINEELKNEHFAPGQLPLAVKGLDDLTNVVRPIELIDCNAVVK